MIALVVAVTNDQVELASDALWALGVVAVEERGAETGSSYGRRSETMSEWWPNPSLRSQRRGSGGLST